MQNTSTLCIKTVGSTYSDALSLTSTPQKRCLVDASYHLVTYVLTCLKQHIFPSCSPLPSKVGNAHTCHSPAFSPLFHHTMYSVPNQASSFFHIYTYIHTYVEFTQTHFNWCSFCTSKSLLVRAQKLPTSHFALRPVLSEGQINHGDSHWSPPELAL